MRFPGLLPALEADPAVRATLHDSQVAGAEARDITCATSFFATATALLASESGRTTLLVTSTFREAEAMAAEIAGLLGEDAVAYYPAWETLPHERLSPRADTVGKRLARRGHRGLRLGLPLTRRRRWWSRPYVPCFSRRSRTWLRCGPSPSRLARNAT